MYDYDDYDAPLISDADIEMAEMDAEGDRLAALRRAGYCTHGSAQGDHRTGRVACTAGCGHVFADDDEWANAEPVKLIRRPQTPGK